MKKRFSLCTFFSSFYFLYLTKKALSLTISYLASFIDSLLSYNTENLLLGLSTLMSIEVTS